jgi:capsid protein
MIQRLPIGKDVKFGNPPMTTEDGFTNRVLRKIAAAIGTTYEDLTGDYSQVNFSSARMSRMAHWANVYGWQWDLLIPQVCDPAWGWAMEAAAMAGIISATGDLPTAEWTPQPMPMTEPDREARANVTMIRSGQKTLSQVIREQGGDPDLQLDEYAKDLAKLDAKGIWLDSDVRRVSQAGLTQLRAGAGGGGGDGAPADQGGNGATGHETPADPPAAGSA